MPRVQVCKADEVAVGRLLPVMLGRAPLVVTRLPSGEIRAFSGRCPHQGASLAAGCVSGCVEGEDFRDLSVARSGEVIRCPWHGFEWDMVSGFPLVQEPQVGPMRLRFYDVAVEGDDVVIVT